MVAILRERGVNGSDTEGERGNGSNTEGEKG